MAPCSTEHSGCGPTGSSDLVRLSTEHLLSRGTNRSSRHRFGIPFAAERGLLPSGHAPHSRRPRPRRACHRGERVSRGCASPPHTEFSRGCVARVPSQHVKCPRPEPGHFPRPLGRGLGPPGGESAGRGGPRTRPASPGSQPQLRTLRGGPARGGCPVTAAGSSPQATPGPTAASAGRKANAPFSVRLPGLAVPPHGSHPSFPGAACH